MHAEALALARNFITLEDVALLKYIAGNLPRSDVVRVIDLGCGSGTTATAILEAHQECTLISYDISQANLDWTEAALKGYGLIDRWRGYRSDAAEAAFGWIGTTVDVVLLDASHMYEETLAELTAWAPLVEDDGWIWCHDYAGDGGIPPGENGVKRAVDEFIAEHEDNIVNRIEQGLGIAFRVQR